MNLRARVLVSCFVLFPAAAAYAQDKPYSNDRNEGYTAPAMERDYDKRVAMVPMRDGVKLYTVIWVPKGAQGAPILLTRTPYDAAHHVPISTDIFRDATGRASRSPKR